MSAMTNTEPITVPASLAQALPWDDQTSGGQTSPADVAAQLRRAELRAERHPEEEARGQGQTDAVRDGRHHRLHL